MYSEDYEKYFYERLSKLRSQKNVSARDMSLSIGQSENYINSIENKRMLPSMMG
ncbi:helix-turn-helix transcriptional regulator, partial [Anaerotignum lactatifermentans]|uniref:helix-turn-helix domain-containing protein n=2 Tax=Anaerotignaceae TaxID=3118652 RepID=UPI003080D57B